MSKKELLNSYREMSEKELVGIVKDMEQEKMQERVKAAESQESGNSRRKILRKNIARALTILEQKKVEIIKEEA